jgi:hypothetical protein
MDGTWNRYNLKSTEWIYTSGILKCSEKFKVLDLPPQEKNQVERDLEFEVARVLAHPFQSSHQGISNLKRHSQSSFSEHFKIPNV